VPDAHQMMDSNSSLSLAQVASFKKAGVVKPDIEALEKQTRGFQNTKRMFIQSKNEGEFDKPK
jgi:hypothetical protein